MKYLVLSCAKSFEFTKRRFCCVMSLSLRLCPAHNIFYYLG